jgi:hypothetical protein
VDAFQILEPKLKNATTTQEPALKKEWSQPINFLQAENAAKVQEIRPNSVRAAINQSQRRSNPINLEDTDVKSQSQQKKSAEPKKIFT